MKRRIYADVIKLHDWIKCLFSIHNLLISKIYLISHKVYLILKKTRIFAFGVHVKFQVWVVKFIYNNRVKIRI